jgi:hypothetical protein
MQERRSALREHLTASHHCRLDRARETYLRQSLRHNSGSAPPLLLQADLDLVLAKVSDVVKVSDNEPLLKAVSERAKLGEKELPALDLSASSPSR